MPILPRDDQAECDEDPSCHQDSSRDDNVNELHELAVVCKSLAFVKGGHVSILPSSRTTLVQLEALLQATDKFQSE